MRVTLGFPTYDRPAWLREALESCLAQDYRDLEVLVVDNGSGPETAAVLAAYDDRRLRVVRLDENVGIQGAYNVLAREASGELIAQLGDDDVCLPDRVSRCVAVFDRYPETGVVHGDVTMIDGAGAWLGGWPSQDYAQEELLWLLVRRGNPICAPSTMVHRRVYDAVGSYDPDLPIAGDFDFWLRAAAKFRFRHVAGGPVVLLRRHGDNGSDESKKPQELREVGVGIERAIARHDLRELVPELDWSVLPGAWAERRARLLLADDLERRGVPRLPGQLRDAAGPTPAVTPTRRPRGSAGRLLMTSFGFDDPGGGTLIPRLAAKELAQRGWDVTVFHAVVARVPDAGPYTVQAWEEDGVRLVGVFNRAHDRLDLGHPRRELDDPAITAAFAQVLADTRPDAVHFHNLHNLGGALIDTAAAAGVRSLYTPHNLWLLCPRNHLMRGDGTLCDGPAEAGVACASCVGSRAVGDHVLRRRVLQARVTAGVDRVQAVSATVRDLLVEGGLPADQVDVVRLGAPAAERLWQEVGRDRPLDRRGDPLVIGYVGGLDGHKGIRTLVAAAQGVTQPVVVRLHGHVRAAMAHDLRQLDTRGLLDLRGPYVAHELPGILAGIDVAVVPSAVWETSGLTALEALAARVPVIATRMGGLTENVRDEIDGLIVDGRDTAALSGALARIATEPGLLERLRAGIEAPRTFAEYVDDLERAYAGERVVEEPRRRPPLALRWTGDQETTSSLAVINREVTRRLAGRSGLAIERRTPEGIALDSALNRPPAVEVRHQWPPDLTQPPLGRLALIQPWEFGAIPQAWQTPLAERVDEVWVPSEYVRSMYLEGGVPADRVHVVPNGVDLDVFAPDGPVCELDVPAGTRFLFVGGTISRKGVDVLVNAYVQAFAGRDDVTLIVKDVSPGLHYRGVNARDELLRLASDPAAPRVLYIDDDLSPGQLAALYRACDVLVHPYRGEGFAMPVLEAMACGLPVIVTAGGPTDEFCPDAAAWRIPSRRVYPPQSFVAGIATVAPIWVLEPDSGELGRILVQADADPAARTARGQAAAAAALAYGWDAIADAYAERIAALATRTPRGEREQVQPLELPDASAVNVLAAPAWRGQDALGELLRAWADAFDPSDSACLYLLADPDVAGDAAVWEAHVLMAAATAGVELEAMAELAVLDLRGAVELPRALAAVDVYVPLHAACAGHERLARAHDTVVLAPTADDLRTWRGSRALTGRPMTSHS